MGYGGGCDDGGGRWLLHLQRQLALRQQRLLHVDDDVGGVNYDGDDGCCYDVVVDVILVFLDLVHVEPLLKKKMS